MNGSAIRAIALFFDIKKTQAGRVASAGSDYRYGYNGMEEEDRGEAVSSEIASTGDKAKPGEANLLNTEFRLYDPRLGQWLTRDPVFQPWESPYSAMGSNPILFNDPLGLDEKKSNTTTLKEVVIEVDRIPGAVTPLPSVDVSQYGKNEIRDLPSTVGKDGRNYTNVNGQEVRYVPYAGGETRDFEYSFTLDGVKMWKAFAPLSNGEANARRLRTRLNAIDDYRNITTAALLTPLVVAGAAEVGFTCIANIGLRATNFVLRNPVTVGEVGLTAGLGAFGVETPPTPQTQITTTAKEVVGDVAEVAAKGVPWQKISGIVRDAAKGKGNFGLGTGTLDEAMTAGKSWVGDGFNIASDGKTMISADGLRQFRPPSFKPKLGKTQANFEWRNVNQGQWQGNGHLDILGN